MAHSDTIYIAQHLQQPLQLQSNNNSNLFSRICGDYRNPVTSDSEDSELENPIVGQSSLYTSDTSDTEENEDPQQQPLSWLNKMPFIQSTRNDNGIYKISTINKHDYINNLYKHTAADINGLKTILYPHQQRIVAAMIDIENNSPLTLNPADITMSYSTALLADPVGSGKTIDILALILLNRKPRRDIITTIIPVDNNCRLNNVQNKLIVHRRFKSILTPTIIFVGISVLAQWERVISKFTDLIYFTVGNIRSLTKLYKMIASRTINKYDVILVKNGYISRQFDFTEYVANETADMRNIYKHNIDKRANIYNIINNFKGVAWSRVIIDDYDVINMHKSARFMNALFTWYVSSTRNRFTQHGYDKMIQVNNNMRLLLHHYTSSIIVINNNINHNILCVQNDPSLINFLTKPYATRYIVYNTNARMVNLLSTFKTYQSSTITEMINSESFKTAAAYVNITSINVADMFQKILGNQYAAYIDAIKHIDFINNQLKKINSIDATISRPNTHTSYGRTNISQLKPVDINIKYVNQSDISGLLMSMLAEYNDIKRDINTSIARVLDNIKSSECPICCMDFIDEDIDAFVIFKCCGIVICNTCSDCTIFQNKALTGYCGQCRSNISIMDIIYIKNTSDIANILQKNNGIDIKQIEDEQLKDNNARQQQTKTKISMICDIIRSNKPLTGDNITVFNPVFGNIIQGMDISRPILPTGNRKILIFSNYNETLFKIKEQLTSALKECGQIKILILNGNLGHMNNIINQYAESTVTTILLINSMNNCSGLSLEMSTDIIFTHKIYNKEIETQVIGRAQRIGRTSTLRLHYIEYHNE